MFTPNIRIKIKCDFCAFDHAMVVGTGRVRLSISETADLLETTLMTVRKSTKDVWWESLLFLAL